MVGRMMGPSPTNITEAEAEALFATDKSFSLGCLYAELIIDVYLCGIFFMMVIRYLTHSWRRDNWWTKGTVVIATGLCLVITGYIVWFTAYLFIDNYGMYAQFFNPVPVSWFPLFDALTSTIIQSYFTYRAFRLNGNNYYLLALITSLILCALGSGIATRIIFNQGLDIIHTPILLWLSTTMAGDLIITVSIIYGFYRTKTGWAHTDKLIYRLIRMTFEAQIAPTIIATIFIAVFVTNPHPLLNTMLQGIQSKFYGVGLMYSLNSRVKFDVHGVDTFDDTIKSTSYPMSTRATVPNAITVDVETETYVTHLKSPNGPTYSLNRQPEEDGESDSAPDDKTEAPTGSESQARLTAPELVLN